MTEPHRIRLRGFWAVAPVADGRERHRRPFGRPRTLDPDERAWIVVEAVGPVAVFVNGEAVAAADAGPVAADVTDRLNARNEVAVELPAGAELGEVVMEIRRG